MCQEVDLYLNTMKWNKVSIICSLKKEKYVQEEDGGGTYVGCDSLY